jgi:2'-5' RNA ligase
MGGPVLRHELAAQQLVVVALPTEEDYVRKISSDKEPHLTLLYLGENKFSSSDLDLITGYVEHAASQLNRFGLSVDHRGELGPNKADVLFFDTEWSKDIKDFRNSLLRNDLIDTAYLSASQFPEWTPHLTLGFPENPAKKDTREHPYFSYVSFDRIALWTEDSAGPTFQLKNNDYGLSEVSMSQTALGRRAVADILAHHGVKGMHWGVRKDGSSASSPTRRTAASADTKQVDAHLKKIATGGTRALNTKELQEVVSRMNLEQQYSKMVAEKSTLDAGHDQVKKALALGQTAHNIYSLVNSPGGKALRKLIVGV